MPTSHPESRRLQPWWLHSTQPDSGIPGAVQIRDADRPPRRLPGPEYDVDKSLYHDWGDPREYTIGDMGMGECAGEIVSISKFGLSDAERLVLEAQDVLEQGDGPLAATTARKAMLVAAKALVRAQTSDITDDPAQIVAEFRKRFYDTQLFCAFRDGRGG